MQCADRFKVSPWEIWTTWPLWFVVAACNSLPSLQAQEAFRYSEQIALGTGSMKKGEARRIQNRWAADYRGDGGAPKTKKDFEKQMGAMGLGGKSL